MRLVACVLALAATGCSGDSGSGSDSGGSNGTTAGIDPESGDWAYVQTSVDQDDCGIVDMIGLSSGQFTIASAGDGTFTVDDGDYVFDCTLSGADFSCPDRFGGEGGTMSTMGAQFTVSGEAHGTFSTTSAGAGSQSGDADCLDSACDSMAGMMGMQTPCHVEVSYTIAL